MREVLLKLLQKCIFSISIVTVLAFLSHSLTALEKYVKYISIVDSLMHNINNYIFTYVYSHLECQNIFKECIFLNMSICTLTIAGDNLWTNMSEEFLKLSHIFIPTAMTNFKDNYRTSIDKSIDYFLVL